MKPISERYRSALLRILQKIDIVPGGLYVPVRPMLECELNDTLLLVSIELQDANNTFNYYGHLNKEFIVICNFLIDDFILDVSVWNDRFKQTFRRIG